MWQDAHAGGSREASRDTGHIALPGGSTSGWLAIVHFTTIQYSRAYPEAPKPPWLGGRSGRTGQAAGVSWLDDLLPSEPRAWAFQPPAQPRGSSWVAGASSCLLPRCCQALPLEMHRK